MPQRQAGLPEALVMTPTEVGCLYDVPPQIEEVFELVQKRLAGPAEERKNLKAEVSSILAASEKMPYWRGIYSWILRKIEGKNPSLALGPMFSDLSRRAVASFFLLALCTASGCMFF